ncbi:MAG: c-type cytochrome biogenesis protein CcmI [Burkholderiales bacterium]|nr:c-type cytochrome biogenesis protein CcmI [Burkholderiales bacterium]
MTAFLLAAGLLALLAVLFVVLPLLRGQRLSLPHDAANVAVYRDELAELEADREAGTLSQADYEAARRELERRLLQDITGEGKPAALFPRWPAVLLALFLPLAAASLYWRLGEPAAITAPRLTGLTPTQQVQALLPALEKHLKEAPEDATGWRMLAKAYMALERYPEAAAAMERAAKLLPRDAQVLADQADALAMAQGQRLAGRPQALLARALELDPDNGKALYLAGYAALEAGDRETAARHWKRLLARLPADSEDAATVRQQLEEIGAATPRAEQKAAISGTVRLHESLRARVAPEDTVFVFARAVNGPRMPLAILRLKARELPAPFRLDDSQAMSPAMRLSGAREVVVGARISKSGNATPRPGDLEGVSAPVKPGAREVTVVIDRVVP